MFRDQVVGVLAIVVPAVLSLVAHGVLLRRWNPPVEDLKRELREVR
jgi:hypothetical protein